MNAEGKEKVFFMKTTLDSINTHGLLEDGCASPRRISHLKQTKKFKELGEIRCRSS